MIINETCASLINVIIKSNDLHSLIIYGAGGSGKSYLVLNEINNKLDKNDYIYFNGYSTPLSLYQLLYNNRDKKLIILDDMEGIFKNEISISILKNALWSTNNNERVVEYHTSREMSIPNTFIFNANVIILCNKINEKDINFQALLSRTIVYEMKFTYLEKIEMLTHLILERKDLTVKEKNKCISILKNETSVITEDVNFRLLNKIISFVKIEFNNSVTLFNSTICKNEDKELINKLMLEFNTIELQAKKFMDLTGKSRRTFFRLKKQMK